MGELLFVEMEFVENVLDQHASTIIYLYHFRIRNENHEEEEETVYITFNWKIL